MLFSVPSIIRIAQVYDLFDTPGSRSLHAKKIPRLGGVAIFGAFISTILIFGTVDVFTQYLLAGALVIVFIGMKDDVEAETSYRKFIVQALAAIILILVADVRVTNFRGFWGIYELTPLFSVAFSFLLIIGITNAINLIDGMDGLASSVIILISGTLAFLFYNISPTLSLISLSLAGAHVGFLRYNWTKASIFMGDTGSLTSGFIIACLVIQYIERGGHSAPAISVALLSIPVFDTLRVFVLRILHGRSPFMPDKNHLHHKLLELGLSVSKAVILLLAINMICLCFTLLFSDWGNQRLLLAIIGFITLLGILLEVFTNFNIGDEEMV